MLNYDELQAPLSDTIPKIPFLAFWKVHGTPTELLSCRFTSFMYFTNIGMFLTKLAGAKTELNKC